MRKRPFHITLLAAGVLLAAACDPHEFPSSRSGDAMRDFSLQVLFDDELPQLQEIRQNTKASAAPRTRYTLELYRYEGDVTYGLTPEYSWSFTRNELYEIDTTIFLPVDAARYKAVGWVDWLDEEGQPYYDFKDPEDIRIAHDYPVGEFARDAFSGAVTADFTGYTTAGIPRQYTLTMRRPVAQLRFQAPEALTFLSRAGVDAGSLLAILRYTSAIPDGYDLLRDRTADTRTDVVLSCAPEMGVGGELMFATDFIFCPDEESSVDVDFRVLASTGEVLASYAGSLPVRRGHHTTVSFVPPGGGGGTDTPGGIGISPGFDEEIEVPIGD